MSSAAAFGTHLRALAGVVLLALLALACARARRPDETAGTSRPATTYPRRPPGCKVALYHTAAPGVRAWDDLGVAEIGCHIDVGQPQCLQRLREEACRLGGDILYNVPERPLRPRDQVMVFRGQVAHTRPSDAGAGEEPLPAVGDAGPVEPLVPFRRVGP